MRELVINLLIAVAIDLVNDIVCDLDWNPSGLLPCSGVSYLGCVDGDENDACCGVLITGEVVGDRDRRDRACSCSSIALSTACGDDFSFSCMLPAEEGETENPPTWLGGGLFETDTTVSPKAFSSVSK